MTSTGNNKINAGKILAMAGIVLPVLTSAESRPNIVVVVADDMGKDVLGCYGGKVTETPVIDALASDGVRFTRAYCTSASSAASRAVILTGKYGHSINCYGHNGNAPAKVQSLPVILERSGYRTGQCGKLHVNPESVFHFQNYFKADSRNGYEMAEACRNFIESESDSPFFLYFCPIDPHRCGNTGYNLPYEPNMFGNLPEGYRNIQGRKYSPEEVEIPYFLPDTPAVRAEMAQYCESVDRFDEGLGHLIDILKKSGKYDNTLIIFMSDNGIAFPGAKTNMYEPALNLPFIMKLPGSAHAGTECATYMNWADVTPTLADFAGAEMGKYTFHGRSVLDDVESGKINETVFGSHIYHEPTMYYPMRSVTKGKYKLIWNIAFRQPYPFATDLWSAAGWQYFIREHAYSGTDRPYIEDGQHQAPQFAKFPKHISVLDIDALADCDAMYGCRTVSEYIFRPQFELFDLENDPEERKNLAEEPDYASVLDDLKMELQKFGERTSDPWMVKWFYE